MQLKVDPHDADFKRAEPPGEEQLCYNRLGEVRDPEKPFEGLLDQRLGDPGKGGPFQFVGDDRKRPQIYSFTRMGARLSRQISPRRKTRMHSRLGCGGAAMR